MEGTIVATVILLCGLPGSGKSYLARQLRDLINGDGQNRDVSNRRLVHIEYDALEDSLMSDGKTEQDEVDDDYRRDAWNKARKVAIARLLDEMQSLVAIRGSNLDGEEPTSDTTAARHIIILMDDNFHLRGMRKQIHRLLLPYKAFVRFGILWLQTPVDVCLERNKQRRERTVPESTIMKMNDTLEPPRAGWEINNWMPITEAMPMDGIVKFILECPELVDLPDEPDLEQQAADRARTIYSQAHTVDMLLRSWVGHVAKFDKSLATAANAARKELIQIQKSSGNVDWANSYSTLKDAILDLILPNNERRKNLCDCLLIDG